MKSFYICSFIQHIAALSLHSVSFISHCSLNFSQTSTLKNQPGMLHTDRTSTNEKDISHCTLKDLAKVEAFKNNETLASDFSKRTGTKQFRRFSYGRRV